MDAATPGFLSELINAATGDRDPSVLIWVLPALVGTFALIWILKGRGAAMIYVALIPFLNWTFGKGQLIEVDLTQTFGGVFASGDGPAVIFQPLTILTGLVFVIRDFVQREMGHRVLVVMALAIGWSFFYSWPVIALASAIAFGISETVDWLMFTFTKYRLSTRILLSSAIASPVDTTVFLYGADLARQMNGDPAGTMLTAPNWVFFILGKMVGAVIVFWAIRRREDRGELDPAAA
ncbi:hypothetical protein GC169_08770 [bacterium]|nr:hypothetical protein [bacterium]